MRAAVAALALLVLPASRAVAGPSCGGGDSSSSSSSDASDTSGSEAVDPAPPCIEDTDVHGYRHCTAFGAWARNLALPRISIEVGSTVRRFSSSFGGGSGTVTHGTESFAYRVVKPGAVPLDTAVVGQLRVGIGLPHSFYLAVEGEAGALTDGQLAAEMMSSGDRGMPELSPSTVGVFGATGVAGIGTRLSGVDLGLEAAGGVRAMLYTYDSRYLSCETSTSLTSVAPVLEARARASVWLTPFLSAGVSAGRSVIDDGWSTGLFIGASTRAFGGR